MEDVKKLNKTELLDICKKHDYPENEWSELTVKELKFYLNSKDETECHPRLKRVQRFRK